jgi:diguanylate cyclase (GGDEF)-like protein
MAINNISILVVDDITMSRANNVSVLSSAGYTDIRQASSGNEALMLLNERPAQIVIADWIMPEMDGITLTKVIREQDEDKNHYTVVLIVTSRDSIENLVTAFEQGVDDYIPKPFDPRELIARTYSAERIACLHQQLIESTQLLKDENQHLTKKVLTDPLTGVWNRRYISIHLNNLIKLTLTRGGTAHCAVVDLDHFKKINDEYGHNVGDEVLQGFCERILLAIRPMDVLARLGGEEFVILIYHNEGTEHISSIFGRIRETLTSKPIKTSAGEIPLTASFGIANYLGKNDTQPLITASTLINRADDKLYEAKDAGRNSIAF